MKAMRVWAVTRKEFIHIQRDPRSLLMAIAVPVVMLVLFGYALGLDVDRVPLVVWDQSATNASRELLARFASSRYFSVRETATDYRVIEDAIDRGEALAALVIPREFARTSQGGRHGTVQFIVDGSDSNTATIVLGYADSVARAYNQDMMMDAIRRVGGRPLRLPFDVRARVWFNEDLESRNFIVPGLIAVIMSVIAALLTSLTIAREWERGTMEQLVSTPVKASELIVGKLIPYIVIGMVDMTIAVLMAKFLFHIPIRGSVPLLFALAGLFLVGALAQGVTISILAKSQLVAGQVAIISTFLPAFLLSGFAFAIDNMPRFLQFVTYIVPARYFVTILKAVYLKGVGLEVLWREALLLALFATFMVTMAMKRFRKRLA